MNVISYQECEKLCRQLISIPSINSKATQEETIATYIRQYFTKIPYFQNNPQHLLAISTNEDNLERHSILALLKKDNIKDTIILLGHLDTVDIEDYGSIKEYATDPDRLPEMLMKEFTLNDQIIADINSHRYLFGRGGLDMKAGLANEMLIMKYFSENPTDLNVNLLFLAECDEEDNSKGIISALNVLTELKEKENLNYLFAINADFTTPLNKEDQNHYIYLGTVGKILPCFLAFGKEAHAGSPFQALDPNYLISLINGKMSYNTDFCDIANDECSLVPISLKQSDTKDQYTVQTALSAYTCFNCMLHAAKPQEIMEKCQQLAKEAFDEAILSINEQYRKYCQKAGLSYKALSWQTKVYSFEEWYQHIAAKKDISASISNYAQELLKDKLDLRLFCVRLLEKIREYDDNDDPCIVIFFGSMFYSNIEIKGENSKEKKLLEIMQKIVGQHSDDKLKLRYFYPYISDMSFLNTALNDKEIHQLLANSPMYPYNYNYPYHQIKEIAMPVVNIGTHGKDGHMLSERLDKDYCFATLPQLIYKTIKEAGK